MTGENRVNYNELINRFEVFENPAPKKGYDRHHIVPTCEQKKLYGKVTDNRQIYVSLPMHMWLHILYDRENGTNTAKRFLSVCNKPIEFFTCYELCLAYSYSLRKKREERDKKVAEVMKTDEYRKNLSDSLKGKMKSEETRTKMSDSKKGMIFTEEHRKNLSDSLKGKMKSEEHKQHISDSKKGQRWFNNGIKSVRAYECPEGFVPGMLKRRIA